MAKKEENTAPNFVKKIGEKERQKIKSLRKNKESVWSGLGMFGMVGWSIAAPTLLGIMLGIWLDKSKPQSFSWTLTFLAVGLFIGCLIAWFWVSKEDKEMNKDNQDE